MTSKEQASEAYIKGKLRDHQEYLCCEESRRKQLITCDLYDLEQAFEDGWDGAIKSRTAEVIDWLYVQLNDGKMEVRNMEEFVEEFTDKMKGNE